jgi:ABC-type Zn uptake system ZnuABC Zn-binding protein ZnuA
MKKILIGVVATLVAVSLAGCASMGKGKGKAPPPIVTKG